MQGIKSRRIFAVVRKREREKFFDKFENKFENFPYVMKLSALLKSNPKGCHYIGRFFISNFSLLIKDLKKL